ncbi:transcriptional regulator (FIS family protein) [Desulforapulum autotrophicum HRM2]|uniref:Transcriptional regulator (FIS family protein) n=1 Tax=Desulforapulum autotrophicum (strain ATCC 43914 / DSM 3382 / VKM B-1955 / HRM2) TaxID=177437 RepID=C0QLE2_DESAH|nr:sigma-54 dependent transcriptional regulator [Desulforapulum autotrophicum]ACN14228.1 transcriptional regulator (FIS family protein) [Desulforapulum autotrophicum HRM2]
MYPAILIVDDEASIIESLEGILADDGFEVSHAFNGYEALKKIEAESPDIVLLDIWMPGMDGIETLKEIKKNFPNLPVVMITGHGTIEAAVDATKSGAFDFLEKPLSIDKIIVTINNALNFRRLEEENRYLRKKTIERHSISGFSPAVQNLNRQIMNSAPTDAGILITGENGTGKELVARTLHQFSTRPEEPFIIVNCAAIPEETIDSELFGHERGAFPGATAKNKGKFELASGGTLFLDEIGDMNLKTQAKILRAIESKTFQRIGGGRTLSVDVRIIAATNKDLTSEIAAGNFREDLFYRLNVIPVTVPPLRERKEDIPLLVDVFLKAAAQKSVKGPKNMDSKAMAMLVQYEWPGNVRELKNLIERLAIMVQEETIKVREIPRPYNNTLKKSGDRVSELLSVNNWDQARKQFEKEFFRKKIDEAKGDLGAAAARAGVDQSMLPVGVQRNK